MERAEGDTSWNFFFFDSSTEGKNSSPPDSLHWRTITELYLGDYIVEWWELRKRINREL